MSLHEEVATIEDEPFVPPPTTWFDNNDDDSYSWKIPNDDNAPRGTNEGGSSPAASLQVDQGPAIMTGSPSFSQKSTPPRVPGVMQIRSAHFESKQAVGNTHPSPSWKEISSQVLPAAARELLSSSWRRIYYTARLSYSKGRWSRKYSDMGNNTGGIYLSNNSDFPFEESQLPPFSNLNWVDRQMVREWRTYLPEDEKSVGTNEDFDFERARAFVPNPSPRPKWRNTDVCQQCHKPFGPTRLRHHCRMCGCSFCHPHSSSSHRLPHLGYDPDVPERVCDNCKRTLEEQNLLERVAWRLARCRDYSAGNLTPYFEVGMDSASEVALRITKAAIAMAKSIPLGAQATVAVETVDVLRKYGLHGIYGIMLREEFLAAADLLRRALGINKTSWPLSVHELSAAIFYALAQHRAMRGLYPEREEIIHTLRSTSSHHSSSFPSTWTPLSNQEKTRKTVPSVIDNFALSALSFHNDNPIIDETDAYNPEDSELEHLDETLDSPRDDPLQSDSPSRNLNDTPSLPPGFKPVCDPVSDNELSSLIFYAPIALNFIYATKEVDMQLLAAQQGWHLLYAYLEQEFSSKKIKDCPASAVFLHKENKIACLAIRGTATIHDVITDIRQIPVSFPDQDPSEGVPGNEGEWTNVFSGQGLALCGMASAAVNLFHEHIDCLVYFAKQGYRIRIVGHSMGGGVGAMTGALVRRQFDRHTELTQTLKEKKACIQEDSSLLRVYAYGTPSCMDAKLAESMDSFVTTVVLHDDVFPRLTPTSCRALLKHLLHIRETWVKDHMEEDLRAVGERARTVWRPRTRHSFTLRSPPSSTVIKKYCKKQLQKGKETLLSVKERLTSLESIAQSRSRCDSFDEFRSTESLSLDASTWGEHFFVAKTDSIQHSLDATLEDGSEKKHDKACDDHPPLLLDFLGGANNQTQALIIDGVEFFDPEDHLLEESDGDETVGTDCFRDPLGSLSEDHLTTCDSWSLEPEKNVAPRVKASKDGMSEEAGPAPVVLDEIPLPRMFVPGKVVHIYSHRGVYKAAYVPRTFRELRRISLAGNMLSDHTTKCYYEGLLEVQTARAAPETPPKWSAFDEDDTCCCCASRFTWASTSSSEAQEARDKHNCRSCGGLVCNPCAKNRVPIPSIGLTVSVRVCDRCYNDMGGGSVASSSVTSSFFAVEEEIYDDASSSQGRLGNGTGESGNDRPERRRERRSLVVDELVSRMRSSALTSCS